MKYIEDYHCSNSSASPKDIRDAGKSFFSGHASFSFYCATFLIAYLHARLSGPARQQPVNEVRKASRRLRIIFRGLRVIRPFLQFGILMLALYIAITRISDYKHHPTDVITGGFVGCLYAFLLITFVVKIFDNPVVFSCRYSDAHEEAYACCDENIKSNNPESANVPFTLKPVKI